MRKRHRWIRDDEPVGRLVWVGDWGEYEIPEHLRPQYQSFTKSGWFDKRRKPSFYAPFVEWVKSQEDAAMNSVYVLPA